MPDKNELTPDEEQQLITLAPKIGSHMSSVLYNAFAPKFALTAIETVIVKQFPDRLGVLLTRRPTTDAHYPNMWHSPGSMLRASDAPEEIDLPGNFNDALHRVQLDEIGACFRHPPTFVDHVFQRTLRGVENALVFLCELATREKAGTWFDADDLPQELIKHHYRVIHVAVQYYRNLHKK